MKNARFLYAQLLKLYPRSYREAFGAEIMQTFMDHYMDVEQSEGCVSIAFWLPMISDEIKNILEQQRASLMEENTFLKMTLSKWVLSGVFLIPLFILCYAALVKVALALPHPPVSGMGVLFALATLLLFSSVFSVVSSCLLANALVSVFLKRKIQIA